MNSGKNIKEQLYHFSFLQSYLQQKAKGHTDPELDQIIEEDPFLQEVVSGWMIHSQENTPVTSHLKQKKEQIWKQVYNHPAFSPPSQTASGSGLRSLYQSLRQDLLERELYFLVSFNCLCFLLVLTLGIWISFSQENTDLLSAIEIPEGFKP